MRPGGLGQLVVNLGTRTCYLEVREWSWIEVIGLLLIDTLVLGLL
ncbi:hypothetical protein HanXRQr2_Chr09g0363711 [Helianthus annuus]|uniref:Uncharacterized protein n=1 Tax=Helianthus annuus TaxID=4232 RepID=A0A9K3I2Z0_HELAN|nr:hypothetical protein HanXRQr2_Chr09g0363711 [Helianthus annuus]KAJ0891207.1 hypothetical protein HanPSC8_Chr09g0350891 [Helianthus annuus]